jgi:hypothetical protein
MSDTKPKIGRPDEYTKETGDIICNRIAAGESVRKICLDDDMPNASTVFRWLGIHKAFSEQYAQAKATGAERWADEILSIADQEDTDVQRDKLRVDSRKWLLAKLQPKKYGDFSRSELSGPNGGPLIIGQASDEELEARIKTLMSQS